jgi:hypothetical protein
MYHRWMRAMVRIKTVVVTSVVLVALALVAQIATADTASLKSTPELTHKQVLEIALREARHSADPHPKRIEMATCSLRGARHVMEPREWLSSATGMETVDLVVMHGYFHIDASHPPHSRIAPGKVFELIIGAHTGFVQARSLSDRVPAALSHLGPVTHLRR